MTVYTRTGLAAASIGDGKTLAEMYRLHAPGLRFGQGERPPEEVLRVAAAANGELCRGTIPALLDLVESWEPDVLVHDPFQGAVPIVGALTGLPMVAHQTGIISGRLMMRLLAERLAEEYDRHGVAVPAPPISLEIIPPSIRAHDPQSWQMRNQPYSGPGIVPETLIRRSERPRLVVTLGTVLAGKGSLGGIHRLIQEAADLDAEVLLALADANGIAALGTLPANVTVLEWVPLPEILRRSSAIVHHGGAGTMMAAVVNGIPQLILPHGADHFVNARAAVDYGFGLQASPDEVTVGLLRRLIEAPELRRKTEALRAENAAQPAAAAIVENFHRLVEAHKAAPGRS